MVVVRCLTDVQSREVRQVIKCIWRETQDIIACNKPRCHAAARPKEGGGSTGARTTSHSQ